MRDFETFAKFFLWSIIPKHIFSRVWFRKAGAMFWCQQPAEAILFFMVLFHEAVQNLFHDCRSKRKAKKQICSQPGLRAMHQLCRKTNFSNGSLWLADWLEGGVWTHSITTARERKKKTSGHLSPWSTRPMFLSCLSVVCLFVILPTCACRSSPDLISVIVAEITFCKCYSQTIEPEVRTPKSETRKTTLFLQTEHTQSFLPVGAERIF